MTETKNKLCYELKINLSEDHKEIVASVLTELDVGDFVYGEIDCDLEAEYNPALAGQDLYEKQNPSTPLIIYNEDKEYHFGLKVGRSPRSTSNCLAAYLRQ